MQTRYYLDSVKGHDDSKNADQTLLQSGMSYPKYPILFYKPVTSISGPTSPIPVSKMAQEVEGVDYECELVVVIGKACSNVSKSEALSYVL